MTDITEDQLAKDWTLSTQDIMFILENARGAVLTVRYAMQLCLFRKNARFDFKKDDVSLKAVNYLSRQLGVKTLLDIPDLNINQKDYIRFAKIQDHFSFKDFGIHEKETLSTWLTHASQHNFDVSDLHSQAISFLKQQRIVLPSPQSLGRFVNSVVKQAHASLYQTIVDIFQPENLEQLDHLLNVSEDSIVSSLMQFKRPPPSPNAAVLKQFLGFFEILENLKIPQLDLSHIHPQAIIYFAKLAKNQSSYDLKRIQPDAKRYAILICFLIDSTKTILDTIVDMHSILLGDIERRAKNEFKKQRESLIHASKESRLKTLDFTEKILAFPNPKTISLDDFLSNWNCDELRKACKISRDYEDFEESGIIKNIAKRYGYLRQYSKDFIKLDFEAATGNKPLLEAIKILRRLHDSDDKTFPDNPPTHFLSKRWKDQLYDDKGKFQIKFWEMGVYDAMKKCLSKGDLYLSQSRHHLFFWDTIYKPKDWEENKEESYTKLALPTAFQTCQTKLTQEYGAAMTMFKENLGKDGFATIQDGKIKLCRDDALDISPDVKKLKNTIDALTPPIRIERLIAEVDQMENFSRAFVPLQSTGAIIIPKKPLYGAITVHATNIGLKGMGDSNDSMTADVLRRTSENRIRVDTINNGNTILVNGHQRYPIIRCYGDGSHSGSDGQRFGIQANTMIAQYYPRYSGYYDKMISLYTHIFDQYSVFSTTLISCSEREAYVLDGLLRNETELNPEFHSTDTHGYTDHIFALCYLLGFSFQPRLKDLAQQALYKMNKQDTYDGFDDIFTGFANIELIAEQWDDIVRIAASLKNNIAPAHLIIQRLANREDKVSKALQALGRIVKTIYILRYLCDLELRLKVYLQLNRGESRHALARMIFFDNQGIFKTSDYEEIMNKASCLSLVTNAILLWSTRNMQQIIDRMRAEGQIVDDQTIAKISPLSFKNIIVHGVYHFEEIIDK